MREDLELWAPLMPPTDWSGQPCHETGDLALRGCCGKLRRLPAPPPRDCVAIARKGERQSGSKALGCGSFRLCEIVICMKWNVFIPLARLISNG